MTEYHFRSIARAYLARRPFRAFKVRLRCGAQFHVTHPENMQVKDGFVTYHVPGDPPTNFVFDHESVSVVYDADAKPDE